MKSNQRSQNVQRLNEENVITQIPGFEPREAKRRKDLGAAFTREFHQSDRSVAASLLKGMLIAWLFTAILFAHGCHPTEDNELFAAWIEWLAK